MSCRHTFRAALSSGTFASETKLLRATGRGGHSVSSTNNDCQARGKSDSPSGAARSPSIVPVNTRYLSSSSYSHSTQSTRHLSTHPKPALTGTTSNTTTATLTSTTPSLPPSPSLLATVSSTTMSSMSKTSSWDVLAEPSKNKVNTLLYPYTHPYTLTFTTHILTY